MRLVSTLDDYEIKRLFSKGYRLCFDKNQKENFESEMGGRVPFQSETGRPQACHGGLR